MQATKEWFRVYKMPTGKPPNNFAFDGAAKDKVSSELALNVPLRDKWHLELVCIALCQLYLNKVWYGVNFSSNVGVIQ